jgi:ParB-like chromosome segregation protein Spo0J
MAKTYRNSSARCGGKLSIAYQPVDQLKPDPSNARQHSAKQIRQIAKSIETFGFNVPVLIEADGKVIAGHGRLLAAQRLGLTEIPTIRLEHLSETQKKAFMIADNRLAEVAVWDDRLLAEQLKALASVELAFDIETIGFDMGEIDLRIESLAAKDANASELALPQVLGPAVSRIGDLWLLGRHRVLCGDARDEAAHAVLTGNERGSAVFTDPPYNVPIDGHVSGLGKVRHREFVMAAGEMTPEAYTAFLATTLERMRASSHPGSLAFVCMDWAHIHELLDAAKSTLLEMLNLCIWSKANAGMGGFYRSQHELVFVFKLGSGLRRGTRFRTSRRRRTARGPSPDSQAHRHGRRRHPRRDLSRRHRARPLPRQRHDAYRLRTRWASLPWPRARSALRRRHCSPLAGLYGSLRPPLGDR